MARLKRRRLACDFETTVGKRTEVWLWGAVNIDNERFVHGRTIDEFMEYIFACDSKIWFHNLKFDIQFIFYWLFKHEYKHTTEKEPPRHTFKTLISDMGIFYSVTIVDPYGIKLEIYDSLKAIPLPIAKIPAAFGLEESKGEIEYRKYTDPPDYVTPEEIDYVYHDCHIAAQALTQLFTQKLTKMTAASNALNSYKKMVGKKEFDAYFPKLDITIDNDCRHAYRGGWVYVNPAYQDKIVGSGRVYDVHSMYPSIMHDYPLPYGTPIYYDGKYEHDDLYPMFIECISCCFKLKEGHYPSIQLKGSTRFIETEYITETGDEPQLLYLTSVDHELLFFNYDVYNITYVCGYKFRQKVGMFTQYIDYWYGIKQECDSNGNAGLRQIAKLMLNSLYGKFGTNPLKGSKVPYYDEVNDIVRYKRPQPEITEPMYVPVAAFITAWARDKIIRAAVACGDKFAYADTDSVHIVGDIEPDIPIHDSALGYFGLESAFERAKFHRAKCYIEEWHDGEILIENKKCAGLPKAAKEKFTIETMEVGAIFEGKLRPKIVPGGVILEETTFTIK